MITLEFLQGVNEYVCDENNQQSIIINENNLLSSLSVQQWYDDPKLLASALMRSIAIGHGFQDGNKRTAAIVGNYICPFECNDDIAEDCILRIAKGELRDVDDIAAILYS